VPNTPPTATVAGQSVALHVAGYPDVPNRWGSGHIRAASIRLDYGSSVSPDARRVFVVGAWVRDDGEPTDASVDRYYDAPDGDMSDWPDWIADLARKHTPAAVRVDVLREAADICDEAGAVYTSRALNDHAGAAFDLMERFQRKANEAEYVATPCSVGGCEPGGEPCSTHERLKAHAEGDHELCAPDCGTTPAKEA